MEPFIDENVLKNFKLRLFMRLNLAQSSFESAAAELEEMKTFIQSLPKDFLQKSDAECVINSLGGELNCGESCVQNLILEVESLTEVTWREVSEWQEKYLNIYILSNEQPMEMRRQFAALMQTITEKALKKVKTASRKKVTPVAPMAKPDPVKEYSTPLIVAMQSAIQKFWLNYDPNKLPTQKEVSNFIADQLGEPMRNRMTDDLVKAIRPDV